MCKSKLHNFLEGLPKIEQHMHLEGSLEPDLLFKLAKKNNIQLPTDDPAFKDIASLKARYQHFTSLDDFLHYYFIGMTVLVTQSDFEDLAYAYFKHAHSQNVKHAEVFFDPQAHTSRGVAYQSVVDGFTKARERAATDFNGMTSELIVCLLRHLDPANCYQTYLTAFPDLKSGKVRGLGLSSSEKSRPPKLFVEAYDHARQNGITHLTAHAGEEADVTYMSDALDSLGVVRVDHGVKLPQDPAVLQRFAREKVLVTMCPMSNVYLKVFKQISDLPVREYIDAGVPFSLNSDDPAYFGGNYIQENYCAVQDAFNLTVEEWARIVTNSITLSWCSEDRKNEMLSMLSDYLARAAGNSD